MASLVTKQFSYHAAKAFANSFLADSIYLYIGRPTAWTVPGTPEASEDKHTDHISIWNNMAGAVRVPRNSVALGIKRVNWVSGTVYEKYKDSITSLGGGTGYYILAGTNDRCVYKCLDNNGEEASTIKPTHKNLLPSRELDGYLWKYMYEITDSDFSDFATDDYLPVTLAKDQEQFLILRSRLILHPGLENIIVGLDFQMGRLEFLFILRPILKPL